jgi:hypothetical protein
MNDVQGRSSAEPNRGTGLLDAKVEELVTSLHLRALSEGERVLHVDAQIAYGALDLRVAAIFTSSGGPEVT